jgi:hypothetical protein
MWRHSHQPNARRPQLNQHQPDHQFRKTAAKLEQNGRSRHLHNGRAQRQPRQPAHPLVGAQGGAAQRQPGQGQQHHAVQPQPGHRLGRLPGNGQQPQRQPKQRRQHQLQRQGAGQGHGVGPPDCPDLAQQQRVQAKGAEHVAQVENGRNPTQLPQAHLAQLPGHQRRKQQQNCLLPHAGQQQPQRIGANPLERLGDAWFRCWGARKQNEGKLGRFALPTPGNFGPPHPAPPRGHSFHSLPAQLAVPGRSRPIAAGREEVFAGQGVGSKTDLAHKRRLALGDHLLAAAGMLVNGRIQHHHLPHHRSARAALRAASLRTSPNNETRR